MAKVRLNKIDAGRRLLDAAIRMTFAEEDPAAIHVLAASANRIIRDICERRGDIDSYARLTDWIVPGHESEFWNHWNASANFLKHADRDAQDIHEMDDSVSDFLILLTAKWYRDLGNSPSTEMQIFYAWWLLLHPTAVNRDAFPSKEWEVQFPKRVSAMAKLLRRDQLKVGMSALRQTKGR